MNVATPDSWFQGFDINQAQKPVKQALQAADDGELFLENSWGESLLLDEQIIKEASSQTSQGFGLRGIFGEATLYAHSSDLSFPALQQAARAISDAHKGSTHTNNLPPMALSPSSTSSPLMPTLAPLMTPPFQVRTGPVALIEGKPFS